MISIEENTKPSFPIGYEKLCGSFSDDELQEPKELSWDLKIENWVE